MRLSYSVSAGRVPDAEFVPDVLRQRTRTRRGTSDVAMDPLRSMTGSRSSLTGEGRRVMTVLVSGI